MAKEKDSDKKIAIPESEADKKKALELALKQIDPAFWNAAYAKSQVKS